MELLSEVEQVLPPHSSLIDAVAGALDLSYDAAHRRTSHKSKLSLNEGVRLAKHFNLSLDKLFATEQDHYVAVIKTRTITNESELIRYFHGSRDSLKPLIQQKESRLHYSAKDIPLFYTLTDDLLTRFKLFVWLKLLDPNFAIVNFESFAPSIELRSSAQNLGTLYHDLNVTEIWDVTTINSILKQIHFYWEAGAVNDGSALTICDQLSELMDGIAAKVQPQNEQFLFYYNELLLMNNTVWIHTPQRQSLYIPFSMLSYYQTSDIETCSQAEAYFKKQLNHSKLLNTAGERERNLFFAKFQRKIEALRNVIGATRILDFE